MFNYSVGSLNFFVNIIYQIYDFFVDIFNLLFFSTADEAVDKIVDFLEAISTGNEFDIIFLDLVRSVLHLIVFGEQPLILFAFGAFVAVTISIHIIKLYLDLFK